MLPNQRLNGSAGAHKRSMHAVSGPKGHGASIAHPRCTVPVEVGDQAVVAGKQAPRQAHQPVAGVVDLARRTPPSRNAARAVPREMHPRRLTLQTVRQNCTEPRPGAAPCRAVPRRAVPMPMRVISNEGRGTGLARHTRTERTVTAEAKPPRNPVAAEANGASVRSSRRVPRCVLIERRCATSGPLGSRRNRS